jgi:peptide/nickel transport system permease protein
VTYRRYALERVGWTFVLLWFALTAIYLMFHEALDARDVLQRQGGPPPSTNASRGFDWYFDESYWDYLVRVVGHQSLGRSFFFLGPLGQRMLDATGMTLSVLLFTFVFASLIAVPLGIVWGRRRPGRLTRPMKVLSALLFGLSSFSIALFLIYWVGSKWSLLPLGGYCDLINPSTSCGGFADWARALILPGTSLGFFFGAVFLRLVSRLVGNAERARREGDATARKRAVLSYVKLLGRDFGFAIGFALFVEAIFGIPGLARTFLTALDGFDAPVMEGTLIVATLLAVSVNLAVDLAVAAADSSFRRF